MFGQAMFGAIAVDAQNVQRQFSQRTTSGALTVGNNTIRTPATGRTLIVYRFYGSVGAAATIFLQDGTGGSALGSVTLAAAGTFSFDFTPDGAILTNGNLLNLNSSAAVALEATCVGREV